MAETESAARASKPFAGPQWSLAEKPAAASGNPRR